MRWLKSLRAGLLLARNQRAKAAVLYRDLLEAEPTHVPGLAAVLSDCVDRRAVDDAVHVATRALAKDHRHFMALQVLGWAYVAQGNHPAARPIIERARVQFDSQGLSAASDAVVSVTKPFSRRSPGAIGVDELAEWRRWADSYLAGPVDPNNTASAG